MRGVFVPVCLCSCKSLNATGQRDVFFRVGGGEEELREIV